jgi:hypothetical protein
MSKNSRRTATEPHISVVAHITPEELSKLQTDADVYGGSWNRFLWIASKRARLRPHGGDFDDLGDLQARVRSVVTNARNVGRMRRTPAADRLWEEEYYRRAEVRAGGVVGAIVGRAEPQLLRLAMLAALCRQEDVVDVEDLAAAVALWQYVEATVRMLFAGCEDPLVARVVEAIRARPGISRSALRRLTAKAMPAASFVAILERAAATGAVESEKVESAGRQSEIWKPRTMLSPEAALALRKIRDAGGEIADRDLRARSRRLKDSTTREAAILELSDAGLVEATVDTGTGGRPGLVVALRHPAAVPVPVSLEKPGGGGLTVTGTGDGPDQTLAAAGRADVGKSRHGRTL